MSKNDNTNTVGWAFGICLGVAAGVAVGVLSDNIDLWMPVGLVAGFFLGILFGQKKKDGNDANKR